MSSTTTGAQLAARGKEITLADGTTVPLRFTFRAILAIEEDHGSLMGFLQAFQDASADYEQGDSDAPATPRGGPGLFGIIVSGLHYGMLGQVISHDDGTVTTIRNDHDSRELVLDLLDASRLQEYVEAFSASIAEAFGEFEGGGALPPAMNREQRRATSRGASGGTSRSGKAGTPRKPSGS